MNNPVMNTARRAPGDPRLADGAPASGKDGLAEKERDKAEHLTETDSGRGGNAKLGEQQDRSFRSGRHRRAEVPLEYSPVISNAPKTPPVKPATIRPVSDS